LRGFQKVVDFSLGWGKIVASIRKATPGMDVETACLVFAGSK